MGRLAWVYLSVFWILTGWGSPARAESSRSCESVCKSNGVGAGQSIQRQWDQLFRGQRVCRVDGPISRGESPARWIEDHRDPLTGARMAAAMLTGECKMNRPVKENFRATMDSEGSQGFVRRSFEMVGLSYKPGCVREIPSGSALSGGDVLRMGNQAMMVATVGEDPFGIQARLEEGSVPASEALSRCREWLMDTSKFQISVIFLSQEGRHGARVRQGSFGSLIGEDHPGSFWDEALQEWALTECVRKVVGRSHRASPVPAARLKVERFTSHGPDCRFGPGAPAGRDRECALCCARGGLSP